MEAASKRTQALEEAASVLRSISRSASTVAASGGLSSSNSVGCWGVGDDDVDDGVSDDATVVVSGDDSRAATKPPPSSSSSAGVGGRRAGEQEALFAAAKRRAEERRRGAGIGGGGGDGNNGNANPPTLSAAATATSSSCNYNTMDWFNLLGVVTNPTSSSGFYDQYHYHASHSYDSSGSTHGRRSSSSRHGGTLLSSRHGTPISLDHFGSGDVVGGASVNNGTDAMVAMSDWAISQVNASSIAVATGLDEFTGWFDHYSRKYLGTVPGIDGGVANPMSMILGGVGGGRVGGEDNFFDAGVDYGGGDNDGGGGRLSESSMMMMLEYEPQLGPEDVPSTQLEPEALPRELTTLDLASVQEHLQRCGAYSMRFEDRGGGFAAMRERRRTMTKAIKEKGGSVAEEGIMRGGVGGKRRQQLEEEIALENEEYDVSPSFDNIIDNDRSSRMMAAVMQSVPEIFFSPYFDLTDPVCFENLLVISDAEVAQIREKEAELHALADRKVREAERVAALDAQNANSVPRIPLQKSGGAIFEVAASSFPLASDVLAVETVGSESAAKESSTPSSSDAAGAGAPAHDSGNVITLRKPETFTSHLDAVELVLLDQVRSKSERFFRETNRFSELQQLVTSSVDEVRELRNELQSIRERCVTNVEIVPVMDDKRKDLRTISEVLEAVEDVANCKASIASLMGAGDHLGAVVAIRLARLRLAGSTLEGEFNDTDNSNSEEKEYVQMGDEFKTTQPSSNSASPRHQTKQGHHFSLGKLKALSKVGEQLNEYEKLAVQSLTNNLVDTFLSWGNMDARNVDHRATPRISLTLDERANIRGVVHSLRVCGQLSSAGAVYQRKLCELISVTVRAIVTECVADAAMNSGSRHVANGTSTSSSTSPAKGTMADVAFMSMDQFFDCINMLFDQVLGLLSGAFAVNKFCIDEGFLLDDNIQDSSPVISDGNGRRALSGGTVVASGERSSHQHTPSATAVALAAAADLCEKSVSELLRLRREAHSLVSFDGMRQLWDTSLTFTHQLEKYSGKKAYGLRSTLLAQAKSFVERKHEANMSALVAALDSERWVQCNVSAERQAALTRLCTGRAAFSSRKATTDCGTSPVPQVSGREKMTDAEVEGVRFKVVWSCLLLLEMVIDDVACAAHFQTLATNVVGKVTELLRLFNTRSTHLVLGAGAIQSAVRLKSINAKHLAIVTQCIALVLAILPHIRAALMAQLPAKQHALLFELDKIKSDYHEHCEKVLNKLVSIIGGIVEHSLALKIVNTDYDKRARVVLSSSDDYTNAPIECCAFLENVVTNTKKMHQVLLPMLSTELLRDVFSRIFAYLDHKVPFLFKAAANSEQLFSMPTTDEGKLQMIKEVEFMATTLNGLLGVEPWNFSAIKVLEQELEMSRAPELLTSVQDVAGKETSDAPKDNGEEDALRGDSSEVSQEKDDEALAAVGANISTTQGDATELTSGLAKANQILIISSVTTEEDNDIDGPITDIMNLSQDNCGGDASADISNRI